MSGWYMYCVCFFVDTPVDDGVSVVTTGLDLCSGAG